jgi:tetratricopeptide (TPR) repeat protein
VQASDAVEKPLAIERAMPVFERIGDYAGVAHLNAELSSSLIWRGRYDAAEKVAADGLHICELHNLGSAAYAHCLGQLAYAIGLQGRVDEARAHITRALTILAPHDHRWRASLISFLSEMAFFEGETARALELAENALQQYPANTRAGRGRLGIRLNLSAYHLLLNHLDAATAIAGEVAADLREDVGLWPLQILTAIAALRGHAVAAATALGFLDEWYARLECCRTPLGQAIYDVLVAALQDRLPEDEIDRLRAEGRGMTFDQAIDEASSSD